MSTIEIGKYYRSFIHPKKFALWIAFASIFMMFAAFTSAYMVRIAAGDWLEFQVPSIFFLSTAILITSSITLHNSLKAYESENEKRYKSLLVISFVLGSAFIVCQYLGWTELYAIGIDLKGNVSGSFFYLISIMHAIHILAGLAAIGICLISAFGRKFKLTAKRKLGLELVTHYWHFVDVLWIYLLCFLIFYK